MLDIDLDITFDEFDGKVSDESLMEIKALIYLSINNKIGKKNYYFTSLTLKGLGGSGGGYLSPLFGFSKTALSREGETLFFFHF